MLRKVYGTATLHVVGEKKPAKAGGLDLSATQTTCVLRIPANDLHSLQTLL